MNTVGKPGRLGEQDPLRRLGLDADRGLGREHRHPHPRRPRLRDAAPVRAGRRPGAAARQLRRRTPTGMFEPEYAEVYGVPFSFLPDATGHGPTCRPSRRPTRPGALPERADLRDRVPPRRRLPLRDADRAPDANFDARVGQGPRHRRGAHSTPGSTRSSASRRYQPRLPLDEQSGSRPSPSCSPSGRSTSTSATRTTTSSPGSSRSCCGSPGAGSTSASCRPEGPRLPADAPVRRVQPRRGRPHLPRHRAMAPGARSGSADPAALRPDRLDPLRRLHDDQARLRRPSKSHLNCVVLDSGWEAKLGQVLDAMPEVVAYVKNQGLNFKIPYTFEGRPSQLPARLPRPRADRRHRPATTTCSPWSSR